MQQDLKLGIKYLLSSITCYIELEDIQKNKRNKKKGSLLFQQQSQFRL